jgi:hypothetical protein
MYSAPIGGVCISFSLDNEAYLCIATGAEELEDVFGKASMQHHHHITLE